jgi:hypothetical protein
MSECRRGTRIPIKGSIRKNTLVEVGVEVGFITNVEAKFNNGVVDEQDLQQQVTEKVTDILHIDCRDKVLNNICIYAIQ